MSRQVILLALAALALCATAHAQIYKWTDQDGRVHYSDSKPEGVEYEEVSERLRDSISTVSPDLRDAEAPPKPAKAPRRLAPIAQPESPPASAAPVTVDIFKIDVELSRADEKQMRDEVEYMYRRYVELLGWSPRPRRPVKIRVFRTQKDWDAYPKAIERRMAGRAHYNPATGEVLMHGIRLNGQMIDLMRHEVSHAIFHMEIGFAPQWIDEGLAETFTANGPERGDAGLAPDRAGIEVVKLKIREGSLEPWAKYVDIPFATWRNASEVVERTYYRIAASMMSFLVSSPAGTKCLRDVLVEARKSGFGVLSETFRRHCGDLKKLDADWRKWVARQ